MRSARRGAPQVNPWIVSLIKVGRWTQHDVNNSTDLKKGVEGRRVGHSEPRRGEQVVGGETEREHKREVTVREGRGVPFRQEAP
jgi:hypothetical protein